MFSANIGSGRVHYKAFLVSTCFWSVILSKTPLTCQAYRFGAPGWVAFLVAFWTRSHGSGAITVKSSRTIIGVETELRTVVMLRSASRIRRHAGLTSMRSIYRYGRVSLYLLQAQWAEMAIPEMMHRPAEYREVPTATVKDIRLWEGATVTQV